MDLPKASAINRRFVFKSPACFTWGKSAVNKIQPVGPAYFCIHPGSSPTLTQPARQKKYASFLQANQMLV
jgi:hypothetical protein